jgi:hypothetical protein
MRKVLILLGFLVFAVGVVYLTVKPVQSQCEVCLDFDGRQVCRIGAGATDEDATRAAHESACGGNAMGMSESILCRNAVPVSVSCSPG